MILQNEEHKINFGDELILEVKTLNGGSLSVYGKIDPNGDTYYPIAAVNIEDFGVNSNIHSVGLYNISMSGVHDFYLSTMGNCELNGKIMVHRKKRDFVLEDFRFTHEREIYTGAIAGLAVAGLAIVGTN